MKRLLKNFFRFFYDQKYQAGIRWVRWTTKMASPIHQHIWTLERFPAGIMTVLIYHYINHWIALAFFIFSALTDWFDGKVARYRMNSKHIIIGRIDKYIQRLKEKENKNLIERIIASDNFGDVLDGTADKFFVSPIIGYFGFIVSSYHYYWILIVAMIIIDITGNPTIKILEKKGMIEGEEKIYKHSVAGKIKYALQIVLVLLLWNEEVSLFMYQEVVIYFVLSIATALAFLSVFCKIKPSTCQKLWQSSGN